LKWLISDQQDLKVTTTLKRRRFTIVVRFEDARFSSSVCFNEAEFHASVNFDLAAAPVPAVPLYFNGAKFINHPPLFFWPRDALKIQIGQMLNCQVPSCRLLNLDWRLEYDKRAYEQLRIKCGALGKVEDEHLFFRSGDGSDRPPVALVHPRHLLALPSGV
jgi:hypothetical protein